ncbi:P-loop NTPase family protein [Winogradskyella arenosi]|uniref:DNA replication protein DnaC n=1 Tax=Winogradskyella arenosi TaxID=533325 RepID=A0A368ZIR5_9FLAO|nr:hypothetical protein [Winogradskyella arenosi]RCW93634.1 hypothetical protein DFQ08_101431 [Winogradskyella arenosi]
MRIGETQPIREVFSLISSPTSKKTKPNTSKSKTIITKQQLWNLFCNDFFKIHGKVITQNEDAIENLKVLFYYFLEDSDFFKSKNLIKHLNEPTFNKGLIIIGGVGIGKTAYLKCFENIFHRFSSLRFKGYSAKHLVREFEKCTSPLDKDLFYNEIDRKRIFIDDIGSEKDASNYGIINLIGEIISDRYDKNQKTFLTTNFINANHNVEDTLQALGKRYGHRNYDRLFEMCNIIVFTGQSMRK